MSDRPSQAPIETLTSVRERIAQAVIDRCGVPDAQLADAIAVVSFSTIALSDHIAAIEAAGYAAVPLEPTEGMVRAIDMAGPVIPGASIVKHRYEGARQDYRDMLAARPR